MTPKRSDRAQGTVTAIGMLVLGLLLTGLAIDTTKLIIVRRSLQNACDAAVLAGASAIDEQRLRSSGGTIVKLDPANARRVATEAFARQRIAGSGVAVSASETDVGARVTAEVAFTFLQLMGVEAAEIDARCRAEPRAPG